MGKNHILGIGIDIESINRFEKLELNKESVFLNKVFTKAELDYCFSKKNVASSLATKYVGKEAVVKACNLVSKSHINYKEIEIINDSSGAPKVSLLWDKEKNIRL